MQKQPIWLSTTSAVPVADHAGLPVAPMFLDGSNLDDLIQGLAHGEVIDGRAGNDQIDGGDGHDTLEGRDGNDVLRGGRGDDRIAGGAGDDVMTGGEGADVFFWSQDEFGGVDRITDFEVGVDYLHLPHNVSIGLETVEEGTMLTVSTPDHPAPAQHILLEGLSAWTEPGVSLGERIEQLLMPV